MASAAWRSLGSVLTSLIVSSLSCLSCGNAVSAKVHQVRGAAGLRPRAPAIRLVYRRPRAADCRPLSVFPPVRG